MDNRRYQELRTYCMADLGDNMMLPGYENVMKFAVKMGGDTGRIKREEELARSLFQCHDLTTRERAAAYLLSVITNHRIATWQREPSPPNGQEPMPPLDKAQSDELARVTCDAVTRYAAFLADREAAVLLTDCKQTAPVQPTATPASVGADCPVKPGPNKSQKTLLFEAKVLELLDKFWNDRTPGTEPTKSKLCKLVYEEILRTPFRGARKTTQSMVNGIAKKWPMPMVLPTSVPESKFNDKRHPFKSEQ